MTISILDIDMDKQELKIGDTFKVGKSKKIYEVIGIFEENGQKFIWGRTKTDYGFSYSHAFTYDDEGKLYERS